MANFSQTPVPASQCHPHPTFYDNDRCFHVFQVEDTLFTASFPQLKIGSEMFKSMFSISGPSDEGTNDNPIFLPVTVPEFESFLAFVNHLNWDAVLPKEQLLAILKLCHLFINPDGIRFAVKNLNSNYILPPSQTLELGGKYGIRSWITTSTQSLLRLPLLSWTPEDIARVPTPVFAAIAKAREAIDNERKIIAAWPPKMAHSPSCVGNEVCGYAWDKGWWSITAREVLHPRVPLSIEDIPVHVSNTVFPGVHLACRDAMVDRLFLSDTIQAERDIKQKLLLTFYEYFGLPRIGDDPVMEF